MTGEFCIAVHALVFLHHKAAVVSSEAIAANVCTNPARIRKVMAKLKRAELVATHEGTEGGYAFLLEPSAVTLRRVCEAVDTRIVSSGWRSGSECDCLISSGMADLMDSLYARLELTCLDELATITLADVSARIFSKSKGCAPPKPVQDIIKKQ